MKDRKRKWYIDNEEYKSVLSTMHNKVEIIYKHSKSYYFTDHTRTHSERIIENLIYLFPFLFYGESGEKLNDVEKFILFSAILLHDIGIQMVNSETLSYIVEKYKIRGSYNEDTKLDFIRTNHHILSKYWIKENTDPKNTKLPQLYIGDKILAKYICNVVESHGIDFEESKEYTEVTAYGNNRIRMGLLCTLLSLGDALDCDQRRIDYQLLKISDLSIESRLHWMKHYYVDGIVLTPNLIEIYYSFPDVKEQELKELYQRYFVNKTKYWIEKCFTVRGKFLFPVGAICRVVDIVHFSDDKDELTNNELLRIQDGYVRSILDAGKKYNICFLQYLVAIIMDSDNKILYIKPTDAFNVKFVYENKGDYNKCLSGYWEQVFENDITKWEYIGSNKSEGSIHKYYLYRVDNVPKILKEYLEYEWLDLYDYLEKNNDPFIRRYFATNTLN